MSIININVKKISEDDEIIVFSYVEIITGKEETEGIIHLNKVKETARIVKTCSSDFIIDSCTGPGEKGYVFGEAARMNIVSRYYRGEPVDDFNIYS